MRESDGEEDGVQGKSAKRDFWNCWAFVGGGKASTVETYWNLGRQSFEDS